MTSRDRLLAALNGELPDRLPWAPEFNETFCARIFEEIPGPDFAPENAYIEACRRARSECFARVDAIEVTYPNVEVIESRDGDEVVRTFRTPGGDLTLKARIIHEIGGGEMEYDHMIKTVENIRAYTEMYRTAVYKTKPEFVKARHEAMGEHGVYSIFGPPTPLLDIIMFQVRLPNVYFLMDDHPAEMDEMLAVMHQRNCEYYDLAASMPGEVVRPFEDTSTTLVSPEMYRRYCHKQLQDYRDICHSHGKLFVPHMCGLLKGVLPELAETAVDGIEALTPPPLGDCPIGLAREKLNPNCTLVGGLDPTQFVGATPAKTKEMFLDYRSQIGNGLRFVLGHEEIHIRADFESVRVIPDLIEEYATFK